MKCLLRISVCFAALAVLFACAADDGDPYDRIWTGYANVRLLEDHIKGHQPRFELVLDDETVMNIVTNNVHFPSNVQLYDDTRVVVSFLKYDEYYTQETKEFDIGLLAMVEVLCKKPVYNSTANLKELGKDPINVEDLWCGGRYLNANFEIMVENNSDEKHFINLLVIEDYPHEGEEDREDWVYVELRHNAYGEFEDHFSSGRVSFDITDFLPEGKNSVNLSLQFTNYDGQKITRILEYKRNDIQSPGSEAYVKPQTIGKFY